MWLLQLLSVQEFRRTLEQLSAFTPTAKREDKKSTHLDIFKLFTGVRVKIQLLLLVLFSIQTFLSSRKTINHSAASSCDSSSGTVQFESPFGHFHIIVPVALERGCNCHIKPHQHEHKSQKQAVKHVSSAELLPQPCAVALASRGIPSIQHIKGQFTHHGAHKTTLKRSEQCLLLF